MGLSCMQTDATAVAIRALGNALREGLQFRTGSTARASYLAWFSEKDGTVSKHLFGNPEMVVRYSPTTRSISIAKVEYRRLPWRRWPQRVLTPLGVVTATLALTGRGTQANRATVQAAYREALGPGPPRGYPGKKRAATISSQWAGGTYVDVCAKMRGTPAQNLRVTDNVIRALDAYMKHSAPVAPLVPRAATASSSPPPDPLVLWRGVRAPRVPAVGSTVRSNGGCFTAFSYSRDTATDFAGGDGGGVLYRLQADRIARGTPWAWFIDRITGLPVARRSDTNSLRTYAVNEREVLLPPGYFKVLRRSTTPRGLPVLDIAYVPDPRYVRAGAVPRLVRPGGAAVTKTTGGDRLEVEHDNLARRVAMRAARGMAPPRRAFLNRMRARTERTSRTGA